MDIFTNKQTSNIKGIIPGHKGKTTKNYQGLPNFLMETHNFNHRQILQRTHTCYIIRQQSLIIKHQQEQRKHHIIWVR